MEPFTEQEPQAGGRLLSTTALYPVGPDEVLVHMKLKVIIGLVCATCLYGCAVVSGDLEYRVDRLEREKGALEAKLATAESQLEVQKGTNDELMTASAELKATMDAIRANIQALTGKVDEVEFAIRQKSGSQGDAEKEETVRLNRVEEIARTNKDRITKVEQYLDFEATTPPDADAAAKGEVKPVKPVNGKTLSEAEVYATGKQAFDGGQYEIARENFQELLSKYPKSENADNAQFWIGEIYYREKWYEKAIMEYQKVIENYPDGNKVPASLLKQGLSFYNLNEQSNARLILQEVINKYPTSNEAKIARDKLKTF
jgi:tol-pal system protein YbgF